MTAGRRCRRASPRPERRPRGQGGRRGSGQGPRDRRPAAAAGRARPRRRPHGHPVQAPHRPSRSMCPRTAAGRSGGGPGAAPRKSRRRYESHTADGSTVEEAVAAGGRSRIPRTDLAEEGEVRLAGRPVTVRWAVAEHGSVPDADRAPGNVTPVARAFPPATERGRKAPCASDDVGCPGVRSPCTGRDVRVTTYRLEANCEASPQISAPALVRTHQRQLTGTCKLFGMPRNRNTEAPRLVVTT
jgi:hypothetical protein